MEQGNHEYWFIYIDETGDDGVNTAVPRCSSWFGLVGVAVRMLRIEDAFNKYRTLRKYNKSSYGIQVHSEYHSYDLVNAKGYFSYNKTGHQLDKQTRFNILKEYFEFTANNIDCKIITLYIDKSTFFRAHPTRDLRDTAIDYLLNRFNVHWYKEQHGRGIENHAVIIHDEGNNNKVRHVVRKLKVFNWITNPNTGLNQNLPLGFILEDALFKESQHSWFLQLADLTGYALRGRFDRFGALKDFELESLLPLLKPVLVLEASKNDLGIVRPG